MPTEWIVRSGNILNDVDLEETLDKISESGYEIVTIKLYESMSYRFLAKKEI